MKTIPHSTLLLSREDGEGFCLKCGAPHLFVTSGADEPFSCEECGALAVFSAETILDLYDAIEAGKEE